MDQNDKKKKRNKTTVVLLTMRKILEIVELAPVEEASILKGPS